MMFSLNGYYNTDEKEKKIRSRFFFLIITTRTRIRLGVRKALAARFNNNIVPSENSGESGHKGISGTVFARRAPPRRYVFSRRQSLHTILAHVTSGFYIRRVSSSRILEYNIIIIVNFFFFLSPITFETRFFPPASPLRPKLAFRPARVENPITRLSSPEKTILW